MSSFPFLNSIRENMLAWRYSRITNGPYFYQGLLILTALFVY